MRDVIFIGGGGHAASCLDAVDPASMNVVGYVARDADESLDLPHLGGDDALPELQRTVPEAFVAVGDNARRATLTGTVTDLGFRMATIVAGTARVSPTATVGPGSVVLHGALVGPRSRIGAGVVVNTAASVDHDCTVGDFAHIAPGTHLAGGVRFGTGSFAGVGVSVIPDVHIEDWAVMGAGSVVIDRVPAGTTVMGAPARTRRRS
jgi:sugar O-acyltransferase (sialic acid O-acetyltransferase NeuD family)